jgi:hypothetical protein
MANGTGVPSGSTGVVLRITRAPGDVNANGVVNIDDLLAVINSWGPCPGKNGCSGDIAPPPNGNGAVNIDDLLLVINSWG